MARNRRRTRNVSGGATGQFLSGLWMLILGVVVGIVGTLLYTGGTRIGQAPEIGSGIRELVRQRDDRPVAESAPAPVQPSQESPVDGSNGGPLDYYERLKRPIKVGTIVKQRRQEMEKPAPTPDASDRGIVKVEPNDNLPVRGYTLLQIASVTRYEKADELKARLALEGIQSFIQRTVVQGTERYRVRVGPFETDAAVEDMRARLNGLGVDKPMRINVPGRG